MPAPTWSDVARVLIHAPSNIRLPMVLQTSGHCRPRRRTQRTCADVENLRSPSSAQQPSRTGRPTAVGGRCRRPCTQHAVLLEVSASPSGLWRGFSSMRQIRADVEHPCDIVGRAARCRPLPCTSLLQRTTDGYQGGLDGSPLLATRDGKVLLSC